MTDRATLEALLARVLEGEGWDRELNADIAVTLGGWQRKWQDSEHPHGWYWRRGDYSWTAEGGGYPVDYLASKDAALTLVPEGWTLAGLFRLRARYHGFAFECALMNERRVLFERGEAATPARALIAACIKAMMEMQGE